MKVTTTKCGSFGHPEFVLEANESVVPDVYLRNAMDTVEGMVAQGSVFRPGQTVQIGWMLTRVENYGAGLLSLSEPDMQAFPIKWTPGVTETLRQMMLQLFMLDSVSLRGEMAASSILQSAIVCSDYTGKDFFMQRAEPTNQQDSGWFLGCLHRKHDHQNPKSLLRVSLYDAFLHQRGIQGFVSFPVGSMIVMDHREGMRIFKDGSELPIASGSFLDAWFKKQKQA